MFLLKFVTHRAGVLKISEAGDTCLHIILPSVWTAANPLRLMNMHHLLLVQPALDFKIN